MPAQPHPYSCGTPLLPNSMRNTPTARCPCILRIIGTGRARKHRSDAFQITPSVWLDHKHCHFSQFGPNSRSRYSRNPIPLPKQLAVRQPYLAWRLIGGTNGILPAADTQQKAFFTGRPVQTRASGFDVRRFYHFQKLFDNMPYLLYNWLKCLGCIQTYFKKMRYN